MSHPFTWPARLARSLRERRASRQATTEYRPDHERQVAAAQLYVYRLRNQGASIEQVAADIGVSPRTLQSWVHANWKWGGW
ncbi:helix-turn-helix domain-containing protein [Streptomyces longisporoflavus]|uniref:Helix-turn-helix domain-containing protein n=1 Tax=Streptomyces longisporoflavus TaxID=28044 RepID=A0ABW7R2R3_9ACTN